MLWRYANNAYPPPAPDNPVVDVRLPDGTRVSAAFPPAATAGVVASIRRTVLPERVLVDLVPGGNKDVQALLDALVATRRNVIVTGDAAALPSVLAAFGREVPADRRVVAIGAAARSRSGWIDLAPTADAAGLLRVAASLRPDHLVVGELSGPEAGELVLVATRGQNGILLAMPGRTAAEAITRFGALAAVGLGATGDGRGAGGERVRSLRARRRAPDGGARIIEIGEPRASGTELALDVALSLYSEGAKRDAGGRPAAGPRRVGAARRRDGGRRQHAAVRAGRQIGGGASRQPDLARRRRAAAGDAAFFDRFRSAIARLPAGPDPRAPARGAGRHRARRGGARAPAAGRLRVVPAFVRRRRPVSRERA